MGVDAVKLSESDKSMLESKIEDTIQWLDENPNADTEEVEEEQKSLTEVATPILQKMAASSGGGSMPDMSGFAGGMPGAGAASSAGAPSSNDPAGGPTIEEID